MKIKKPSKKQEQRDKIITLIRALKETLEDSPLGVKRSDLDEMEEEIQKSRGDVEQHENRLKFLETKEDRFSGLLKVDIRRMIDEALTEKGIPPKRSLLRSLGEWWSH